MPLRDFFHRPLADECDWSTFHGTWITTILQRLNRTVLKKPYTARSFVRLGTQVEVDVSALKKQEGASIFEAANGDSGGVATATRSQVYTPPAVQLSCDVAFVDPDLFEVKVYRGSGAWKLVAAIELVSESNKDRDDTRRSFAIKCASYLQKGVSIVVVDTVTNRSAELHNDLCDLLDLSARMRWASPSGLHAASYRVTRQDETVRLDAWPYQLALGESLPTLPLWLAPNLAVPLELELTYGDASESLNIE
jgi:uncharacterized protein DUF4058